MTSQAVQAEPSATNVELLEPQTYIKSPIDTLLESLEDNESDHISPHDLLHAYDALSSRVRSQIGAFATSDRAWHALVPLQSRSTQIIRVLRRDILRVCVEPSQSHGNSLSDDISATEKREFMEASVKYARDMVSVSHHALRFLSDIFRFSALRSAFASMSITVIPFQLFVTHRNPVDGLHDLLNDLLVIANTPVLPTPCADKTFALAAWILQTQTLPISVLLPKTTTMVSVLKRNLEGHPGRFGKSELISDSLKVVSSTNRTQLMLIFILSKGHRKSAEIPRVSSPAVLL